MADQSERWGHLQRELRAAIYCPPPPAIWKSLAKQAADALDARDAEIARLREALEDTIRSPKGVVPDSAALIEQAKERGDG